MTDYTPSMDDLRRQIQDGAQSTGAIDGPAFDRAIAAHDAELRAEIAAAIRAEKVAVSYYSGDVPRNRALEIAATIAEGRTP